MLLEYIQNLNVWAILAGTISAFVLGGIWYSPPIFGKVWMREAGIKDPKMKKGHSVMVYSLSFILCLIAAAVFAFILGPDPMLELAIATGAVIGLCFVATSYGINYLFSGKSLKLFLIDAGYHVVKFVLFGLIMGLWH